METENTISGILALIPQPAFAVRDGRICCVNRAAAAMLLEVDTPVSSLLHTGVEEYAQFCGGQLFLTLDIGLRHVAASVSRMQDADIFVVDPEDSPHLQAMALAARSLREPLAGAMLAADKLLAQQPDDQTAILNQRLHQLLRLVGNMTDAERFRHPNRSRLELQNAGALICEILDKATHLLEQTGLQIHYEPLTEDVYCPLDAELLERGILNILSNAAKHAPKGTVDIRVSRQKASLVLSFRDNGNGITNDSIASAHIGYQRQAGLESMNAGIGLGMVLIRAAATAHDGTVLIDRPAGGGTRVTLTLQILPYKDANFRNHMLHPDYAGERDHAMVELSEHLPSHLYKE